MTESHTPPFRSDSPDTTARTDECLCTLCDADIEALEALIEANYESAAVPEPLRPRAERLRKMLGLLDSYPIAPVSTSSDLNRRTFDRIHQNHHLRLTDTNGGFGRVPHEEETNGNAGVLGRFNLRDTIGLAAAVILLIGLAAPILADARHSAQRQQCRGNMLGVGIGLSAYSNDFQGSMPIAFDRASIKNEWYSSRANSANLFLTAKTGHVSLESLCCPSNPRASNDPSLLEGDNWPCRSTTSFSFQNMMGRSRRTVWNAGPTVLLLSDKNPFICAMSRGESGCSRMAASECHGPDGQNVLSGDGSAMWLIGSILANGDNIWLPGDLQSCEDIVSLRGNEVPTDQNDTMLIH